MSALPPEDMLLLEYAHATAAALELELTVTLNEEHNKLEYIEFLYAGKLLCRLSGLNSMRTFMRVMKIGAEAMQQAKDEGRMLTPHEANELLRQHGVPEESLRAEGEDVEEGWERVKQSEERERG